MSSSLRRSRLEALKKGESSSEESDYYNEEEEDNYQDDLDSFIVEDQDVGYKASAHQKQSRNKNKNNNGLNRSRTRQKSSQQSQSYNISRKRRNNAKNNKTQSTQSKTQATMNNFFKTETKKPQARNVVNRNRKSQRKKAKNKPTPKQNEDDYMQDIMDDLDNNSEEDADVNNADSVQPAPMDDPMDDNDDVNNDAFMEDVFGDTPHTHTQPQTAINNISTQDTVQTHYTQTQMIENSEPPKKKFKFANTSPANDMTLKKSDKMEMSDDENMSTNKGDVHMFMNNDSNDSKQTEVTGDLNEDTDNYPQSPSGYIDFFWFDAYEDPINKPGQIYLFGKTLNKDNNKWESICVYIKNIQRTMYVLPRLKNKDDDIDNGERVDFLNVYHELNAKRDQLGIAKFAAKPVTKKYCFRDRKNGVPSSATYLKCCYSFQCNPFIGGQFETGNTYRKIFGTRSTALELFILDKQIMGPCWLRLPYKKPARIVSWCKHELMLDDMEKLTVLSTNYPSPSLKVLSLSFQTILNDKKEHEVACISGFIDDSVCVDHSNRNKNKMNTTKSQTYFTFIRKIDRNPFPYDLEKELAAKGYDLKNASTFKTFSSERELLTFFTLRIQQLDPDVIVGHKLYDFLLDVTLHRMDKLNISLWSKIGRLRKGKIPFIRGRLMRKYLGCGRLFCDTFISSQDLITGMKTYTLSHLVAELLGVEGHENLNSGSLKEQYFSGKSLCSLITHCCNDSNLIFKLMLKLEILPLTKELTNLCGNLWSRSMSSQRAERNEWLLLHEFHRNGYIVPDKETKNEKIAKGILSADKAGGKKRGKAQYAGGLVLEPIKGLYDKYVICLDFNSLYPSIIQEYNLCFTSTQHWKYEKNKNKKADEKEEEKEEDPISSMRASISAETGILPKVIGVLLNRRSTVKKLLKQTSVESDKKRLDIQQKALKLVANSMYGCLGFSYGRFYCQPIAALITALGRESLMKAAEIASSIANLKVIYGDTDSIFIYTDCDNLIRARNFAKEIKKKVNKTYNKMYLELDYVFSKMLLLRKKKYAANKVVSFDTVKNGQEAVNIVTKKEIKGLDLVRRDWSIISKEVGKDVLDIILSREAKYSQIDDIIIGIQELLTNTRTLFDENKIELNKFKITKKLTRQPKDYTDPNKLPHVLVALQMQKLGLFVDTGSFIEYIVCKQVRDGAATGNNKAIAQRAYHIKEIETSMQQNEAEKVLQVDRDWYLAQQILPPVGRYCEPIQETDIGQLAHALGLDSNKFNHIKTNNGGEHGGLGEEDIDDKILRIVNPLQKYSEICEPLKIKCRHCGVTFDFCGVFNFKSIEAKCGLICPTTGCKGIVCSEKDGKAMDLNKIKNTLSLQVWHFIYQYYGREYVCIDIECNHTTQQLPHNGNVCPRIGCTAKMKETYSAGKLFDQLRYFAFLFDRKEQEKLLMQRQKQPNQNKVLFHTKLTKHEETVFDEIYSWIKKNILQKSEYYFLDSKVIFKYLM